MNKFFIYNTSKPHKYAPPPKILAHDPDYATPSNPLFRCPDHILCSDRHWFCQHCGKKAYLGGQSSFFTVMGHDGAGFLLFIKEHKECKTLMFDMKFFRS